MGNRLLSSETPKVPTAATYQRITGTTSTAIGTALTAGKFATLIVSSVIGVNLRWGSSAPTAVGTDIEIPASGRIDWYVEADSTFVAAFPSDGAATFECWIWES
jgi:hypothetical protein